MEFKVGCCGWACAHQKYYKDFRVIEIQETFYQPGAIPKYEKWRKESPCDFEFVLKAPQLITHRPTSPTYRKVKIKIPDSKKKHYGSFVPTEEVFSAWDQIDKIAKALETKVILFQCPAGFNSCPGHRDNLQKFFKKINRRNYILVLELRADWKEEIKKICQKLDLVHCVDPLKENSAWGRINYFRLHGLPGYNLDYSYKIKDLVKLKKLCDRKVNYVMFNNLSMQKDAKRFQKLL